MDNITFSGSQLLTLISVVAAVYFAAKNWNRNNDTDVSSEAQFKATMTEKLDGISEDTKEIKKEITDVKTKVSDLSERVVIVEQSTRSAHHRLDTIEGRTYDEPRRGRREEHYHD
jgi:uncharacterized protein (DUF3084 family)